jgi:hypothetical protein
MGLNHENGGLGKGLPLIVAGLILGVLSIAALSRSQFHRWTAPAAWLVMAGVFWWLGHLVALPEHVFSTWVAAGIATLTALLWALVLFKRTA